MLRSVKYGLYGAVLAGVAAGSVAWSTVDKTVNLVVDGQATRVHTTASVVRGALSTAGYKVGPHDLVAPAASASIHDGSHIVYKRGRLLHLTVNGRERDVWTTASTLADALSQLGYSTADFTSVSRARRLPLSPTDITLRTPSVVTVAYDGKREQVSTTAATVQQLLADLGIKLGKDDKISVRTTSAVRAGETITIRRYGHGTITTNKVVGFPTKVVLDPTMASGQTKIVTRGKNGLARVTYAVVYVDGKIVGRTVLKTVILTKPTTQVQKVGTKEAPAATVSVSPGTAQAIAQSMMASHGWGADQFNCLLTLWGHESGWRVNAANPSGAYGIPQALPGSKMGPGWQTDAKVQITWGLGYIAGGYGSPCGAWSFWQAHGWY